MDLRFIYALILTVMPITELRVGLPLGIIYAIDYNIPIIGMFLFLVLLNILTIFVIFYFLDNVHHLLLRLKFYKKFFTFLLLKLQKRIDKFENKHESIGMTMLFIFVILPFPGTGIWSSSIISWTLGLERKKSIISIAIGSFVEGIIILFGTLGFIKLFF